MPTYSTTDPISAGIAHPPSREEAFQTDELEAARARHFDSPKGYACFLSHHKQACAAEARLVKQQLEFMLNAGVFLGKCSIEYTVSIPRLYTFLRQVPKC